MKINNICHHQESVLSPVSKDEGDSKDNTRFKYELVGTMIRVMLVKNGAEVTCVKSIPVQCASPEIIAKLEDLTLVDIVMINDLKKEAQLIEKGDEALPKECLAYNKHSLYE